MITFLLKLFREDRADRYKHILVKHTQDCDVYFRQCVNGVPDFTLNKSLAWKFKTPEDASMARKTFGIHYRGMSIIEIKSQTASK